ncbi:hypothetical protein V2J09_013483 [Rumex salicifolius]
MAPTPILHLPDFSLPFVLKTDACDFGVGAVLMQEGHPIAYISHTLKGTNLLLFTYKKKLLAVSLAVDKWRHYLEAAPFIIRTNHQPLCHFLDQKLTTHLQWKATRKLLGCLIRLLIRKGSTISYEADQTVQDFLAATLIQPKNGYSVSQSILRYKNIIVVGSNSGLRVQLIKAMHDSPIGGHSGMLGTYQRFKAMFFWPSMRSPIDEFVQGEACNRNKNKKQSDLLLLLSVFSLVDLVLGLALLEILRWFM